MMFFMVVGAIDRLFGNKFGYGKKFEEGILAIGTLSLAMLGIISFSPLIASFLKPVITPIYRLIGADPAMFAGTILANDMGGYSLSMELALSQEAGFFGGLFLAATMGATLSFTIPVAIGIIKKEDEKYLAKGIMAGISTVPFGCLVGGLVAGFSIKMLILNLIPTIIFTFFICTLLLKYPNVVSKSFSLFSKLIFIVITIGLVLQIIETLTGKVLVEGMIPALEAVKIVCRIGMTLAGAFPMVYFITKVFKKPLIKVGKVFGINENSSAGIIASLAHNIPMFNILKDMDEKGKLLNIAFSVSGAFVLGSHLGFTASIDTALVFPVIVAKLTGGISAMFIANILYNKEFKKLKKLN